VASQQSSGACDQTAYCAIGPSLGCVRSCEGSGSRLLRAKCVLRGGGARLGRSHWTEPEITVSARRVCVFEKAGSSDIGISRSPNPLNRKGRLLGNAQVPLKRTTLFVAHSDDSLGTGLALSGDASRASPSDALFGCLRPMFPDHPRCRIRQYGRWL